MSNLKIVRKEVQKRVFRGRWSRCSFISINTIMALWMVSTILEVAISSTYSSTSSIQYSYGLRIIGNAITGILVFFAWLLVAAILMATTTERQTLVEERQSEQGK